MQALDDLFNVHGLVGAIECDAAFIEHMASEGRDYEKHEVTPQEIEEALQIAPVFYKNDEGKRAPLIMVGLTQASRMLVAPLEPTNRRGVWRAVTAFEANAHHRRRYEEETANDG